MAKEYIDKEALGRAFSMRGYDKTDLPLRMLNTMPSDDAVEVVRCKDCIHWKDEEYCVMWDDTSNPDDYCSYGWLNGQESEE